MDGGDARTHMSKCVHACVCVCSCARIYVCVCVCVYACMHVCTYAYMCEMASPSVQLQAAKPAD